MSLVVITGIQAAGKSTVAQALAQRLPRSVHLRGDLFRRMIVNGRVDMGPVDPGPEAIRQLHLRYQLAVDVADRYAAAGFSVVMQDIILGADLARVVDRIQTRPVAVVVLAPRADVVRDRDAERRRRLGQGGLRAWRPGRGRSGHGSTHPYSTHGPVDRYLGSQRRADHRPDPQAARFPGHGSSPMTTPIDVLTAGGRVTPRPVTVHGSRCGDGGDLGRPPPRRAVPVAVGRSAARRVDRPDRRARAVPLCAGRRGLSCLPLVRR